MYNKLLYQHNIRPMRPNQEYAWKCLQYDLPILINDAPIEIIEKLYTHNLHGFAGYIKLKLWSHIRNIAESLTVISVPEINSFYLN